MNIMKMKCFLIGFVGLTLFPSIISAKAASEETIKIGYTPNYGTIIEPYTVGNEGFGYEYFEEIAKYTDHNYEYVECNWEEGFELLESGEIDLFGPVGKTPEREAAFIYPENEFGYEEVLLAALENDNIKYNDFDVINQSIIGVEKNSSHRMFLNEYLDKNELTPEFLYLEDSTNIHAMQQGDYNLRLTGSLHAERTLEVIANLGVEPFYYITTTDNQEIMNEIDNAIDEIHQQDKLFYDKLYEKYYKNMNLAKPTLNEDDYELLKQKNQYDVGFLTDYAPFSYINEEGEAAGISIDIMNSIATDAEVKFNYVPIHNSDSDHHEEVDFCLSIMGDKYSSKQKKTSESYLTLPVMLLSNGNKTKSVIRSTVGLQDYSALSVEYLQETSPFGEYKVYDNFNDMIIDLENRTLDHIIASTTVMAKIFTRVGADNYVIQPLDMELDFPITFSAHIPNEVVEVFNKLILRLDDSVIQASVIRHIETLEFEKSFIQMLNDYRKEVVVISLGIISIITYFIIKKRHDLLQLINEDELTGALSKYSFLKQVKKVLKRDKINMYAFISLDIDNFKYINEVYGYEVGSQVLTELANQLNEWLLGDCLIARISADEFVVFTKVSNLNHQNKFEDYSAKAFQTIIGKDYSLHLSQGIYKIENASFKLDFMMDCANMARKEGKSMYGSTTMVFSKELNNKRLLKNKVVMSMENAILNKEFKIAYQPKIDLRTNQLIGAEALVRWVKNDKVVFYPNDFIPIFEANGFITKLDYYVFEEVCLFIKKHETKLDSIKISVNMTGLTLLQEDLIANLLNIIQRHEVQAQQIELEITESSFVGDILDISKRIDVLKGLGFVVSMDDFGSGISSLNRLKDLKVDTLKIDREFLTDTLGSSKGITIMDHIISMARELKVESVAEGVETIEQVELLKHLGCDIAQGYYFSKPIFEVEFLSYIEKQKTLSND